MILPFDMDVSMKNPVKLPFDISKLMVGPPSPFPPGGPGA